MSRPTGDSPPRMRGATASVAGSRGIVPKPTAGQHNFMLLGDGTWGAQPVAGLPSQTSNSGKLLTTDGTNAAWTTTGVLTSLTSPASTPLTLATGTSGAAITVLSADNNVGIGTTSPAAKLDVRTVYGLDGLRVYDRNATLAVSVDQYGSLIAAAGIINNTGAYASASDGTALTFLEGGSEKARIDTAGNLLVGSITTNGTASPTAISVVGRLRSYQGSASVANTAYVDVPLTMPRGLVAYFAMSSSGNSGHQSAGFFRAADSGASSNYTLFSQSENSIAVTVPSVGNIRITNNTGGTETITYTFTMIAGQ